LLVTDRFSSAAIKVGDGELEVRLSDGGNWQVKVRLVGEDEWRVLCRGHLDGTIFEAGLSGDRVPVTVGPLTVDPASRRVDVNGAEAALTAGEFELVALLATEAERVFSKLELLRALWGGAREARSALWTRAPAASAASCAGPSTGHSRRSTCRNCGSKSRRASPHPVARPA